ncbi:MAG: bifunctional diguanylate cyclase/phosphodiesterase [Xanthobacteraceae bacterium]
MSFAALSLPAPRRRVVTPRLIATLALFVVSTTLFCAIVSYVLVRQADDRQALERRSALLAAVQDNRASGVNVSKLDPIVIRSLERTAGLKDLRFEAEPAGGSREMQSVVDIQGRIVGWFSWEAERSMAAALRQLQPLLALTGLCLIGFAGLALWQIRRAIRDLGHSEKRAWTLAHEDMLTRLPNHRKMIELIDAALAERAVEQTVTLAFIDLDGMNDINDALGQSAGDQFLAGFAQRLRDVLPENAIGGRFDGDQFAVVMVMPDTALAEIAIETMMSSLARAFWVLEQAVQVGVTVGLAHAPLHGVTRDELTRRADLALRHGKRKRRGGMTEFDSAMDVEFNERRFIERELKRALADKVIDVHYQPIISADGNRIVGAEALARWCHPVRGAIPPSSFIPVAEQSGLMGPLGEMVLRRALSDAKRWPGLSIAVNLSPVQVRDPALVAFVTGVIEDTGIEPSRVILEVTEGVLIEDPDEAQIRLDALRALGVRLALDDFGTGYSSLAYLQRFRFDKLKIDKAFVDPLRPDGSSQAMIQAIVTLGRALGLELVAEGVETEEQRVILRLAGCDEMQGYLFAVPGPREALDRLIADNRAASSVAIRELA